MTQRLFERGGVTAGRADHRQRVRRPQRERHQDQRRHPQPVAARPHGGRLVGRLGGGGGRRARQPRHRRRRRRVDPHPGRLHGAARHEGHLRAHPARAPTPSCGRTPSCSATSAARCATRRASTTCAPASTPRTRPASRRPAAGRPASARRTCAVCAWRSSRTSEAPTSSPASRTASAPRPRRSSPTTTWWRSTCGCEPPNLAAQWAMGNLATLLADLGDKWPACSDELTDEIAVGLHLAEAMYNLRTAAAAEELRMQANEVMAAPSTRSTSSSRPPTPARRSPPTGPPARSRTRSSASCSSRAPPAIVHAGAARQRPARRRRGRRSCPSTLLGDGRRSGCPTS